MRMPIIVPSLVSAAALWLVSLVSCSAETPDPIDDSVEDSAEALEEERGPLGKADTHGSCQGYCGTKSAGACWCDSRCEFLGDCCDDYGHVCDEIDVCEVLLADFAAETKNIRYCQRDEQCGQVLTGTSCGCTRNWVARVEADLTVWNAMREAIVAEGCGIPGGISTCDCPPADGFACEPEAGMCTWSYL